jgi:hypothetical protein
VVWIVTAFTDINLAAGADKAYFFLMLAICKEESLSEMEGITS